MSITGNEKPYNAAIKPDIHAQDAGDDSNLASLAPYLISRFVVVLLLVMVAESLVAWTESRLGLPALVRMSAATSQTSAPETASPLQVVVWTCGLVLSLVRADYAQTLSFAIRSGVLLSAIAMLFLLLVPPLVGAMAFSRLVMQRVRAIEERRADELARMDERRNQFLTDVAHDLRTPLMAIGGMSHALADGIVCDQATQHEYYDAICTKVDGMSDLVNSVFEYSKLGGGELPLEQEKVDVSQMILNELARMYSDFEEAGLELDVRVPEEPCVVWADRVQLARLIDNLLVNAVRHNEAGVTVCVMLVRGAGVASVVVADTGISLAGDPDDLFEPFAQGDSARASSGGSGLGLAICRRIATMHGFDLHIEQPYGRFTKAFVLLCPVVQENAVDENI